MDPNAAVVALHPISFSTTIRSLQQKQVHGMLSVSEHGMLSVSVHGMLSVSVQVGYYTVSYSVCGEL